MYRRSSYLLKLLFGEIVRTLVAVRSRIDSSLMFFIQLLFLARLDASVWLYFALLSLLSVEFANSMSEEAAASSGVCFICALMIPQSIDFGRVTSLRKLAVYPE